MMKTLLLLFLTSTLALGQTLNIGTATFGSPPWTPTNNSDGIYPSLWLRADYSVTTNELGGVTNWVDLTTNAYAFTTNGTVQPTYYTNTVNGHKALTFVAAQTQGLRNASYTNWQANENWYVLYMPSTTDVNHNVSDSVALSPNQLVGTFNTGSYYIKGDTEFIGGGAIAGAWYILRVVFDGASSEIWTNNVQAATGDFGTDAQSGLQLGFNSGAEYSNMSLAEMLTFRGELSATARTNLYNYLDALY